MFNAWLKTFKKQIILVFHNGFLLDGPFSLADPDKPFLFTSVYHTAWQIPALILFHGSLHSFYINNHISIPLNYSTIQMYYARLDEFFFSLNQFNFTFINMNTENLKQHLLTAQGS